MPSLRIGTRGSPLALWQARSVAASLAAALPALGAPDAIEIVVIRTSGDRMQSGPLADLGGKGLFTKEIEEALLDGAIDLAVHSYKDVPTWLPGGLAIGAVLAREDPRDALIAPGGDASSVRGLGDLAAGAVVGTASLRRAALLRARRPDLRIVPLRGNVETRLRKIEVGEAAATILALAGLKRLGLADRAAAVLSTEEMLPAVCQGIVAIECRDDDARARDALAQIDHRPTATAAAAERAFLAAVDGSCRTPIAALATLEGDGLAFRALAIRPDGSGLVATSTRGGAADAERLGREAGAELRRRAGPGIFA